MFCIPGTRSRASQVEFGERIRFADRGATMRKSTNRALGIIGIAIVGWAAAPAAASAGGARLYEMTENMKLTPQGKFEHRKATSELTGTGDLGTPLCQAALVPASNPGATWCTIGATCSDNL